MFYASKVSDALRFGDVLKGFFSTTPIIKKPPLLSDMKNCSIDVFLPKFSVVMDPCCQIGEQSISLTPLLPIKKSFLANPYLKEDLTRLNRVMTAQQSVIPEVWEAFSPEEKQRRAEIGEKYASVRFFIYENHDLLPKYTMHIGTEDIEMNYYLIDFRNTHKLSCNEIITAEKAPLELKVLELSVETRQELRDKVSSYYAAVPEEDEIEE